MAHLFKQPELSRGNENFHLCRAAQILCAKSPLASSLAQSLSSVSTAGAPGPVSPHRLSEHRDPDMGPNTNPFTHSGGKLKS